VDDDSHVYYAGVANAEHGEHQLLASSGRVLLVESSGDTIEDAQRKVYGILDGLDTTGMFYRHDIGAKAL
jgi:phosphoribosylamine--glycine ligase